MPIGTYTLLTPDPIVINPVDNSEKPNFYDILIEDEDDKDGDVTVMTDNMTPQGKLNLAGNVIVDANDEHGNEPRLLRLIDTRSLVQIPKKAKVIAQKMTATMNEGS